MGRKSELSRAELHAVFGKAMSVQSETREVLIADFRDKLEDTFGDVQGVLDRLGGTVKIAEVFYRSKGREGWDKVIGNFLVVDVACKNKGKFKYGVSLYSFSQRHEEILKNLLKNIKKILKENSLGARFVNKPWKSVSNVVVAKEGLIEKGAEVLLVETKDGYVFGRTLALQDFESYGLRDYVRPRRNPKRGMLPPKLAQMMINIAIDAGSCVDKTGVVFVTDGVIYDPFCGNGTVLMEATLMGLDVLGSDIDAAAVTDSQANLYWLQENYPATQKTKWKVFQKDAREVVAKDLNGLSSKVRAVVTESYLGPPMKSFPDEKRRGEVEAELAELIPGTFQALRGILKKDTAIVLSLPVYRDGKRYYSLKKPVEKIKELGYSCCALLDDRESLIYDRPDQIVGREIWKFKRV